MKFIYIFIALCSYSCAYSCDNKQQEAKPPCKPLTPDRINAAAAKAIQDFKKQTGQGTPAKKPASITTLQAMLNHIDSKYLDPKKK